MGVGNHKAFPEANLKYCVPDFHICELTCCESATSAFGGTRSQEVLFAICEQVADLRSNSQLVGLVQKIT